MEKEERALGCYRRVDTERTLREGEMKGDNGSGRGIGEKTEGQWGGEESRGSEGGNGSALPDPG